MEVAVLRADGTPILGFEASSCDPVDADHDGVSCLVTWRGKSDLSPLGKEPVRLSISLSSAQLYAFRFSAE